MIATLGYGVIHCMVCLFKPYLLQVPSYAAWRQRHMAVNNLPTYRGPIYKISYDLSYDYRNFVVRSTYDSDLKCAEISLRNIVS